MIYLPDGKMTTAGEIKEAKLQAQKFEDLLKKEIVYVEDLMKAPTETLKVKTLKMMAEGEIIETGKRLIRRVGLVLLKFNSLSDKFKIGLFDKLMEYIEKFRYLLEEYGRKIGVESFSIEVDFPWGVSISFTFKPRHYP